MCRQLFVVLGNGFTIDYLDHIGMRDEIDVCNLFRYGAYVPWPADGEPGFLSYRHCPNLWNLGARPDMTEGAAMVLIEEIMTCVNVYSSHPKKSTLLIGNDPNDIYIFAYKELSLYLKHLFIYYHNKVGPKQKNEKIWRWQKFLKTVWETARYTSITIVTYNYDLWLEYILKACDIPFYIGCLQRTAKKKVMILKPHGSISFRSKECMDQDQFEISPSRELSDSRVSKFKVVDSSFDVNAPLHALIPPAGAPEHMKISWATQIRRKAIRVAQNLNKGDDVIICGLSYWHVDRTEIDKILVNCPPNVNVRIINPKPPHCMSAVVTSIFENNIEYDSIEPLMEYING